MGRKGAMSTVIAAVILLIAAVLLLVAFTDIMSGSSEEVEEPPDLSESLEGMGGGGGEDPDSCDYTCVPEDEAGTCKTVHEDQACEDESKICCEGLG